MDSFPTSNPQQIWAWGRPKPLPVDAVRPPSRFRRLVLYSTLRRGIGSDDVDAAVTVMGCGEGISGRNQNPIHKWPSGE